MDNKIKDLKSKLGCNFTVLVNMYLNKIQITYHYKDYKHRLYFNYEDIDTSDYFVNRIKINCKNEMIEFIGNEINKELKINT